MRVLVVEPEAPLMRILERGLRAHGHEVVGADTALHAMQLADDESIRCVVLDRSLPDADNVVRLYLRHQRPQLPVIELTSRDDPAPAESREADSLPKPFALEELIGRIHARTRAANEQRVTTLVSGDLRLDLLAQCAWHGERFIDLPGREFAAIRVGCCRARPSWPTSGATTTMRALIRIWSMSTCATCATRSLKQGRRR